MNLIESMVKGVYNRKLADLIATYQIPIPFTFVNFQDVVVQFAQRMPNIAPEKLEVNVGEGTCFTCCKQGHIAIACNNKNHPGVTGVTQWVMWLLNA